MQVVFCSKTVGSILGMTLTPPEESLADMAVAMLQLNSVQPNLVPSYATRRTCESFERKK